jgi:hypothetical protein
MLIGWNDDGQDIKFFSRVPLSSLEILRQ